MIHKAGWILFLGAALAFAVLKIFGWAYDPIKFYNSAGQIIKPIKIWTDTVTVTSASQTISISSAGFSNISSVSVQPELNTSTAAQMPIASIKSYSTSSVVINFIQSNTTTVGILGVNVIGLQGLQSFSGTRCHVQIIGW